jgi:cytochrome d ubiquinol oxidase subunit II
VYRFQQQRLHHSALFAAASMSALLIGLVVYLMYPFVYPAEALTVRDAVVSPLPMNITFVMAAIFFPVILLYFGFLYSVFSGPARPEDEHAYS